MQFDTPSPTIRDKILIMKNRNFCDEKAALMVPLENLNYPYYREVNFYPKNKVVLFMRFEVLNSLIIMSTNFLKYMTDF